MRDISSRVPAQNSLKRREIRFLARVHMHVYMRVYVFLRISSSCVCNMYVFEYVCMTA